MCPRCITSDGTLPLFECGAEYSWHEAPFWEKSGLCWCREKSAPRGTGLTRGEEFTVQVKNLSQWEQVWQHKDGFNCVWNSYMKTLTLCFTWVDALDDIWSLHLVSNSRAKGGNHLNKTYKLPEILT